LKGPGDLIIVRRSMSQDQDCLANEIQARGLPGLSLFRKGWLEVFEGLIIV
jgi:hypothetical protein